MEGKWLIADRDLNEREGLKWLLKTSSIPVKEIFLAADFGEFKNQFENQSPEVVVMELDMISKENGKIFRDLIQIYEPILLLTSTEATFEMARSAIDLQAMDLMIKPFSSVKIKTAFQKATRKLARENNSDYHLISQSHDFSYEELFIDQGKENNSRIAAFQTENSEEVRTLSSFLSVFPFKEIYGIFPISDMVILLFEKKCENVIEQCQKAMSTWEESNSESLAIVVNNGISQTTTLRKKYIQIRKMLQFTYYKGYRQILSFEKEPGWEHLDPFLTPPEQREWVDMLSKFDIEKIKTGLYSEFLDLEEPFPDPGLVRIRLTSILAQIRRFMKTFNLNEKVEHEKEYRYIFDSILYDSVLYRTVQNLVLFVQDIFEGAKASFNEIKFDPVERAISFMETNFSKSNLRLEEVALFVERNPSYLSHLIMSRTGKSFSEALSGIRMKEAKRLLIETRKPVKEISLLVGYQNPNYFSSSFKEMEGVTPRDFRMKKHLYLNGMEGRHDIR